jgi:hypothetical protein
MWKGNLCELCKGKVRSKKARHKQTRYCDKCARLKKRENSEDPWPLEKRREYMRLYMRDRRAQARLHCLLLFLPLLSLDEVETGIAHAELLAVKVTGLAFVIAFCVRHLRQLWREKDK